MRWGGATLYVVKLKDVSANKPYYWRRFDGPISNRNLASKLNRLEVEYYFGFGALHKSSRREHMVFERAGYLIPLEDEHEH